MLNRITFPRIVWNVPTMELDNRIELFGRFHFQKDYLDLELGFHLQEVIQNNGECILFRIQVYDNDFFQGDPVFTEFRYDGLMPAMRGCDKFCWNYAQEKVANAKV